MDPKLKPRWRRLFVWGFVLMGVFLCVVNFARFAHLVSHEHSPSKQGSLLQRTNRSEFNIEAARFQNTSTSQTWLRVLDAETGVHNDVVLEQQPPPQQKQHQSLQKQQHANQQPQSVPGHNTPRRGHGRESRNDDIQSISSKVELKQAEWRARDAFFLQTGALSSLLGNKCVDSGNGAFPGKILKMWQCSNTHVGPNQRFDLSDAGLLIQPAGSNKKKHPQRCVTLALTQIEMSHTNNGSDKAVQMTHECNAGRDEQIWHYIGSRSRHKTFGNLQNKANGECLTKAPTGRNTSQFQNSALTTERCSNSCNQSWSFGNVPHDTDVDEDKIGNQEKDKQFKTEKQTTEWQPKVSAGRILCWILTFPAASDTKASAVNNTWGRKCTYLLYMTTQHVAGLNTVVLDLQGPEGRDKLWTKSKLAWLYVYKHYLHKADWFIKNVHASVCVSVPVCVCLC
eukprot:m.122675 g.122675  ORF g.122675 m.122675 type:complete len:453 (+) comp28938_c0_seq2:326-1684(+)